MNTDFSDLSVMQMSDSFFPTGLYTMSNGLETLLMKNKFKQLIKLKTLLKQYLVNKLVRLIALHYQIHMSLQHQRTLIKYSNVTKLFTP